MTTDELKSIINIILNKQLKYFLKYILLSIIISTFGFYFFGFLKTKALNLATKSDLHILTNKVESIKYNYLKKIEDYKKVSNQKRELEKTIINKKTEIYNFISKLTVQILKRIDEPGNERKLLKDIFWEKIPDLLIQLNSHVRIKTEYQKEIETLNIEYNIIADFINEVRKDPNSEHKMDVTKILLTLDKIQKKLIGFNKPDNI